MKYDQNMHKDIEAINDAMTVLHDKLKNFHWDYCHTDSRFSNFCDTTNLNLFADYMDEIKSDEVKPVLEQVRDAFGHDHAEIDTMEADETAMLHFYQTGVRW